MTQEHSGAEPAIDDDVYREQHKQRLNHMPWLFYSLKPKHQLWANAWQQARQRQLMALETVHIGERCFIASNARIFAEPGRTIHIGDHTAIAADCYLHGPIRLGKHVSLNQHCRLEGSRAGIVIGDHSRIAANCHFYAFNHGISPDLPVHQQPITSKGIHVGIDVWIGAACAITDGVRIGDHAVIGINSTVTRDVDAYAIMAGSPARKIGDRRDHS